MNNPICFALPSKMSPLVAVVALHFRLIKTNSLIAINSKIPSCILQNLKALKGNMANLAISNHHSYASRMEKYASPKINELDEMRLDAYESSISYKERTKRWHDKRIQLPINYERGDKVLLFNLRLRLFPGKLMSTWYGPFSVSKDMKNEAIKLYDEKGSEFIVDKQQVKPYQKNVLDTNRDDDITLEDQGEVT
ncbi:hypothetical protein Tco_0152214 [Tanacetum coccineum]